MKDSILNYEYIEEFITTNLGEDVKYRWSHGATKRHIGDGLIIYTLINFFKLKTLVCLGSGGGFIPRIMTQARYDLSLEGFYEEISMEWGDTKKAYYDFFVKQDIKIDLLHIDANHTFDSVKEDFELYTKIVNKGGIITIHDTDKSYVDNFVELEGHEGDDLKGPSDFVKTIDREKFEVINFFNHGIRKDKPSSSGLTIVRRK